MIIRVYHLGTMNFQTKIYLIIVEIFMFGPKWFTDRLANIGNHRKAAWIKKTKQNKKILEILQEESRDTETDI